MKKNSLNIKNKLVEFIKNNKICTVLFFTVILIFGLCIMPQVGESFDEKEEQRILKMNIKEYAAIFGENNDVVQYFDENGIPYISLNEEQDHGLAPYYLFAPLLSLESVSENVLSNAWHLYTFILFFVGGVFFFKLCNKLFNKKVAYLGTMLYFFMPRLFIDGMYNNKDCILLSLCTITLYFGYNLIKNPNIKDATLLAIFGAFASNIKISGFFILGIIGIMYIFNIIGKNNWSLKKFGIGCLTVIVFILIYLLITPAIWGHGFNIVNFFQYCLGRSIQFDHDVDVLFDGKIFNSSNPLPWYYIPKMMVLTIPIVSTILVLSSIIVTIFDIARDIKNKKKNINSLFYVLNLLIYIVPIIIAGIKKPILYNGWRHLYFLYVPYMIMAMYGLNFYANNKIKFIKKTSSIVVIVIALYYISIIYNNGSLSIAYFNQLAGANAQNRYQLNYYGSAMKKVEKIAIETFKYDKVYLYGVGASEKAYLKVGTYNLSRYSKNKIVILNTQEELNNAFNEGLNPVIYIDYSNAHESLENYELVYEYKINNNKIFGFYQLNENYN
jgi:hypothetical protein